MLIHWLVDESVMTRGSQELKPIFPWGAMVQVHLFSVHGEFTEYKHHEQW